MINHNFGRQAWTLENIELFRNTPYPVLSEEGTPSYDERKEWERFWLVDPLDGTKEFIKRNGEFTIIF